MFNWPQFVIDNRIMKSIEPMSGYVAYCVSRRRHRKARMMKHGGGR